MTAIDIEQVRRSFPSELIALDQWVVHKPVMIKGELKRKVPHDPKSGLKADSTRPGTWASFNDACTAYAFGTYDGIGFVFADNGFVGIDFDHCITDGVLAPEVAAWVERFNSYTEYSPSGKGIHIIVKGKLPGKGQNKKTAEMYDNGRYFTVTGRVYGERKEPRPAQDEINDLYAQLSKKEPKNAPVSSASLADEEILTVALNAKNGAKFALLWSGQYEPDYKSQSEADLALCNLLAFYTGCNHEQMDRLFRQSGLYREKWDREDYAERTISEAIAGCNEVYNPAAYSQKQALQSFVGESIPQFYDGKTFLHNVMGDYLIKALGVCKINGTLHVYKNGVYVPDEDAIHGEMIKLCRRIRDTQRKEVYKYIKACPETPVKKISPPHLIPFKSRIYNLHGGTFIDYSPEYVFLNRFPYDNKPYAPEQSSITRVIEEIACGDRDVINLLYEAMGNCFYLLNSYRGAVMLYGRSGNNGKSTLLNIILQLVGVENASSLALQDTAERFRLYGIYGKAANIGDDIPETYLPDTSLFKKLVTGEPVIAEQKGQDPVTFKSYAKLFFSMNTLPRVNDKSRAFFSRILLIPLNRDFSAGKQDVSLKNREWSEWLKAANPQRRLYPPCQRYGSIAGI